MSVSFSVKQGEIYGITYRYNGSGRDDADQLHYRLHRGSGKKFISREQRNIKKFSRPIK